MTISGRLGYEFELTSDENTIKDVVQGGRRNVRLYRYRSVLLEGQMDEFPRLIPRDNSFYASSDTFMFIIVAGASTTSGNR